MSPRGPRTTCYYRSLDGNNPGRSLVKFYLATAVGPRLSPYLSAQWSWTVRSEFTKGGLCLLNQGKVAPPFVIPLSNSGLLPGRPGQFNVGS
jgi:hypothetical protein